MHGDEASIWPSIGNHDFACGSHYVIERGSIVWERKMSRAAIERGREKDRLLKRPPASAPTPMSGLSRSVVGNAVVWIRRLIRKILG
jgi:hypothetical protein